MKERLECTFQFQTLLRQLTIDMDSICVMVIVQLQS